MAEEVSGYGSGNGGLSVLGCSCMSIVLAMVVSGFLFLLFMLPGSENDFVGQYVNYLAACPSCCCCLGVLLFPVGGYLVLTDESGPKRQGKFGR